MYRRVLNSYLIYFIVTARFPIYYKVCGILPESSIIRKVITMHLYEPDQVIIMITWYRGLLLLEHINFQILISISQQKYRLIILQMVSTHPKIII